MHSGYGAETLTTDCFGAEYENRIWAHGKLLETALGKKYILIAPHFTNVLRLISLMFGLSLSLVH